jgi:hypothetical protein
LRNDGDCQDRHDDHHDQDFHQRERATPALIHIFAFRGIGVPVDYLGRKRAQVNVLPAMRRGIDTKREASARHYVAAGSPARKSLNHGTTLNTTKACTSCTKSAYPLIYLIAPLKAVAAD